MNETEDVFELENLYKKSKYLIKHFAIEPEILKRCKKIATYCLPRSLKKEVDQLLQVNHREHPRRKRKVAEVDPSLSPTRLAKTKKSPKNLKRTRLF